MVQSVGPAAAEDGNIINAGGDFRIPVADPSAGLAMLLEGALRAQKRRVGRFAHRRHGAREMSRQRLAGELVEVRLGIEQVDMAGTAVEEAPDDVLRRGGEMRLLGRDRVASSGRRRGRRKIAPEPSRTAAPAPLKPAAGTEQKIAARCRAFEVKHLECGMRSAECGMMSDEFGGWR